MTFKFENVYLNNTATVVGPYEAKTKYRKYFDKYHLDLHLNQKTWEKAEQQLQKESLDILLRKVNKNINEIDLVIGGDLSNQIATTSYTLRNFDVPHLGIYSACAISNEALIMASSIINQSNNKNIICLTSSHNCSAEKQFRYPTEYGSPKPKYSTFTTTAAVSYLLSNKKSEIKITSGTIGKVIDLKVKDPFNMGGAMVPAAANTLKRHLDETGKKISDYDLILTGDLGLVGKKIFKEYLLEEYNIKLKNYQDAGSLLYENIQYSGASGPAAAPLIFSFLIYPKMKTKKLNKVLLITTGALHSKDMINQKESIPSIAHAISFEVTP